MCMHGGMQPGGECTGQMLARQAGKQRKDSDDGTGEVSGKAVSMAVTRVVDTRYDY